MKNGKRPTVAQRKEISRMGLHWENWLVTQNRPDALVIVHRLSGQVREIPRK